MNVFGLVFCTLYECHLWSWHREQLEGNEVDGSCKFIIDIRAYFKSGAQQVQEIKPNCLFQAIKWMLIWRGQDRTCTTFKNVCQSVSVIFVVSRNPSWQARPQSECQVKLGLGPRLPLSLMADWLARIAPLIVKQVCQQAGTQQPHRFIIPHS